MTEVDRKCSWDLLKIFAEGDWNLLPGDAIVHCFSLFFGWSLWKTRGRVPHHSNTCAFVPFPIWCLLNKLACFWKGLGIVFGITSIGKPWLQCQPQFCSQFGFSTIVPRAKMQRSLIYKDCPVAFTERICAGSFGFWRTFIISFSFPLIALLWKILHRNEVPTVSHRPSRILKYWCVFSGLTFPPARHNQEACDINIQQLY